MKKCTLQTTKGFTLIELLLYMALTLVLVIVVSSVSIAMLRSTKKTELSQEVQEATAFMYQRIEHIASGAYRVTGPTDTSTSSSATFSMYDPSVDPTELSVIDGVLYITEGVNEPIPLHTNTIFTTISFLDTSSDVGFDALKIHLGVSASTTSVLASQSAEMELETTIMLNFTP